MPSDSTTVCIGEVGLGGEIRSVARLEPRLAEAARLSFKQALVPKNARDLVAPKGLRLIPVGTVSEALEKVV